MPNEANDFLFGGGGKAAKFENIGDSITGVITDVKLTQQTSLEDNTPLTWADGSPRMQLVITLSTNERASEDDDGTRRLYAKGGTYEVSSGTGTSMKDAIADAMKKVGATDFTEGGKLTVGYTGEGKKTNRAYAPPKLYRAIYEPPKASVSADDLFGAT